MCIFKINEFCVIKKDLLQSNSFSDSDFRKGTLFDGAKVIYFATLSLHISKSHLYISQFFDKSKKNPQQLTPLGIY